VEGIRQDVKANPRGRSTTATSPAKGNIPFEFYIAENAER